MDSLDIIVLIVYFVFVIFSALLFKQFSKSSSGYINGGGSMQWWMAGATAFMTQFSAWTFTGAAAKAFDGGLTVLFLFWSNAIGFFIAALYFAGKYRRLRVETAIEVIRLRFGRTSESVFSWFSFVLGIVSVAIWLNGLALFVAAVFHIDVFFTILVVGIVVSFIAVSGGAWAVSATNVIQLILLMSITVIIGCYALYAIGGPVQLIQKYPSNFIFGSDLTIWNIGLIWVVAIVAKQSIGTNSALSSYRFLVTLNERDAVKAAWLACGLFVIGPVMWFIPPWVTADMGVNLFKIYSSLGGDANNAAYLYFIEYFMPAGVLGLVLAAMTAATISPMSTAINRTAGIFVRNVYQSFFRPDATELQQFRMSKIASLVSAVLSVSAALALSTIHTYSFFDVMMLFGALLQMPLAIPSVLALIVVKTPDWAGWATVVVGLMVSIYMNFFFDINWLLPLFDANTFTAREAVDLKVSVTLIMHFIITGGFFCLTQFIPDPSTGTRGEEKAKFIERLKNPVEGVGSAIVDSRQGAYIGIMACVLGVLIALLSFTASKVADSSVFILIGMGVFLAGLALSGLTRRKCIEYFVNR